MFEEYKANRSPLSSYGMEINKTNKSPRICGNCKKLETTKEQFKICRRCKQMKVPKNHPMYHYYCCKACQTEHWKFHRFEHTEYEEHHGAFLDNARINNYDGEVMRFRFRFDELCRYNREDVLTILMDHVGKSNLLTVFAIELGKYWVVDMKEGPHVGTMQCEGVKHNKNGYKFKTFPVQLDYENDEFHTPKEMLEPIGEVKHKIENNIVELCFSKNPDLTHLDVVQMLLKKFGPYDLKACFSMGNSRWVASVKNQAQVHELMNEGLKYEAKGLIYVAYARYAPSCRVTTMSKQNQKDAIIKQVEVEKIEELED